MHLIQILLPIFDNEGHEFPHEMYRSIGNELVSRFSGLTAFTRAPAEGFWVPQDEEAKRDDIMVFEVMADKIDKTWWAQYRGRLEKQLRQRAVVIRTHKIELL